MWNLVIVTCAIRVSKDSIFSTQQRVYQILNTIQSIRNRIPDSYIVILEIGNASLAQIETIRPYVNEYIDMSVPDLCKNRGEATMLYRYLNSPNFQEKKNQFLSVNKVSGRYFLDERFDFNRYPLDKSLIILHNNEDRYNRTNLVKCETRYYRMPITFIDTFIERFAKCMEDSGTIFDRSDVEHVFFEQIFRPEECACEGDVFIGVSGWISGSGNIISE